LGDTRFHDPADTTPASAQVRQAMVAAINKARPALISITGDIVYTGSEVSDWKIWDAETAAWQQNHIPIYPALGNHDLKGGEDEALANYFARFPQLEKSRYYSVRFGNCLMLVLDSSQDETSGAQGEWLQQQLDRVPDSVSFVFVILHHPPYTSSSDDKQFGGGHSARGKEQALAQVLEARQQKLRARIIVLTGHVHNYEHHQHGGIDYVVTGGGGAHPYGIARKRTDLFQSDEVNYHYLLIDISADRAVVTMNRLDVSNGQETWSQPDTVTVKCR
jgi:3',5'-cyclic AMP phosphodiesterase CpdA